MAFLPAIPAAIAGSSALSAGTVAATAGTALLGAKVAGAGKGKGPGLAPTATIDAVEKDAAEFRRLRRRRGMGADELLGRTGAEAPAGPTKSLMGAG